MTTARINNLRFIAPMAREQFQELNTKLQQAYESGHCKTWFRPFETFRHPARQAELYDQEPPVTKAPPMTSPHQYGLAVDFVPYLEAEQKFSWDEHHDWHFLENTAATCGLVRPIKWDLAHIEHPIWKTIRQALI